MQGQVFVRWCDATTAFPSTSSVWKTVDSFTHQTFLVDTQSTSTLMQVLHDF